MRIVDPILCYAAETQATPCTAMHNAILFQYYPLSSSHTTHLVHMLVTLLLYYLLGLSFSRLPLSACSLSIASNNALKLPAPNP